MIENLIQLDDVVVVPAEASDEGPIMRMVQDTDHHALADLMRRHASVLSWRARRMLGPVATSEDIEEVVSDTFYSAWQRRETYDPRRASVKTWLHWLLFSEVMSRR